MAYADNHKLDKHIAQYPIHLPGVLSWIDRAFYHYDDFYFSMVRKESELTKQRDVRNQHRAVFICAISFFYILRPSYRYIF